MPKTGDKMQRLNIFFKDEQDKINLVNECEKEFNEKLSQVAELVMKSNIKNVLLSGPSCSGKTTTANKIISDLSNAGKSVIVISLDDFFKERKEARTVDENQKIDYDSVDVLDVELMRECIENCKAGEIIRVPIFDFVSQSRKGFNEYKITENDILIFEGIQAVYPEVFSLFHGNFIGIFINLDEDVCLNGIEFSRDDIRLVRRIVRDRKFRAADTEFTLYLWTTVRENEDKNIYPNKNICKIQLNSFMKYELFLIKKYIIERF